MASNLVKWWKHKILGGYKQFSVQECTTDSEELMYHQVRASSSCSAPPDLLLVSDRENNIPLRSPVVNIIGATTAPATTTTSPSSGINACHITSATNNNPRHNQKLLHQHQQQQHQQQQQQPQQHHHVSSQQLSLTYNGTKDIAGNGKQLKQTGGIGSSHTKHGQQQPDSQQQQQQQQQTSTLHDTEGQMEAQPNNHSSARHAHHAQYQQHHQPQQRPDEHIRLEEFTCDVSVEGGKSTQPLQFSFTFYDLDGHHGKITKDDIVGIVYTIYESIGKSVVVPHSGSKTINVRLTVSPEGKSKTAKNKKTSSNTVVLDSSQKLAPLASASQATRRQHRLRPRKLIKSDEEEDDSNSDRERENTHVNSSNLSQVMAHKSFSKSYKSNKLKTEQQSCNQPQSLPANTTEMPNSPLETIYDNPKTITSTTPDTCRECQAAVDESHNVAISPTAHFADNKVSTTNEAYMKHVASTRMKMLRKSRKQKHQDCMETRQRSLSVGNETCWKNRHLQRQQLPQQQLLWQAEQQLHQQGVDVVDGVQLRHPIKVSSKTGAGAHKRNSAECWKTALNRNDLISIIRESMEKNRLCFQLNGKPQANVSPIRHSQPPSIQQTQHHQQHLVQHQRNSNSSNNKHSQKLQTSTAAASQHRQRSNTISKIPTLIANHNNVHSASPHQSQYPISQLRSNSCANATSSNNNNNNDTNLQEQHNNSTNSSNAIYHHLQPHIPVYHQQLAINPAVIAAHNALMNAGGSSAVGQHGKMNLCGYDSFLHATICGGGLSHSPPPHSSLGSQPGNSSPAVNPANQQIATVQPIMSSSGQNPNKTLSLAVTPNQIKTSKILRSGSFAQTQHQVHTQLHNNTAHNSPQYHGYQRLSSSSKHNLSAMHLISPSMEKPPLDQLDKWRRDQVKNYDQLLYAKLSEKLQQTNLVASNTSNERESHLRRKHRVLRHRRANTLVSEANNVILKTKMCRDDSDYAAMINIEGESAECENLLGQTSDEESHSQHEAPTRKQEQSAREDVSNRHVAEGTLVDLGDGDLDENESEEASSHSKLPLNGGNLLTSNSEVHELHLDDGLDIEADLEEAMAEDLLEAGAATESGRNSADSTTLANASAVNANTTSSSLIHRYVHEHIHHHYHHFEDKEETK